jgi:hypothetical protein
LLVRPLLSLLVFFFCSPPLVSFCFVSLCSFVPLLVLPLFSGLSPLFFCFAPLFFPVSVLSS